MEGNNSDKFTHYRPPLFPHQNLPPRVQPGGGYRLENANFGFSQSVPPPDKFSIPPPSLPWNVPPPPFPPPPSSHHDATQFRNHSASYINELKQNNDVRLINSTETSSLGSIDYNQMQSTSSFRHLSQPPRQMFVFPRNPPRQEIHFEARFHLPPVNIPGKSVNSNSFHVPPPPQNVFEQQFNRPPSVPPPPLPPPPIPPLRLPGFGAMTQQFTVPPVNKDCTQEFKFQPDVRLFSPNENHHIPPTASCHIASTTSFHGSVQPGFPNSHIQPAVEMENPRPFYESNSGLRQSFCAPPPPQNCDRASVQLPQGQTGRSNYENFGILSASETNNALTGQASGAAANYYSKSTDVTNFDKELTSNPMTVLVADDSELREDIQWIKNWNRLRQPVHKCEEYLKPKMLSLTAFRALMCEAVMLNDKLKEIISRYEQQVNQSSNPDQPSEVSQIDSATLPCQNENDETLSDHEKKGDEEENNGVRDAKDSEEFIKSATEIQRRLCEIKDLLNDEVVSMIKEKLKKTANKRKRLKRKQQEDYEEKQEQLAARMKLNEELDQWQMGIVAKQIKIKKDKEMKMAADETLSEVRKKRTEARRCLDLLGRLRKLRSIRKDKSNQKGLRFEQDMDPVFEERVQAQTDVLQRQLHTYELEERTLEVMLETEKETNMKIEKKIQNKREDERIKKYEKQLQNWLFGEEEVLSPSDALYPFRQYYDVGSNDLVAFLKIRQEWDMYAVPFGTSGGSSVPLGWVVPPEPSSEVWATALKNNAANKRTETA